MLISRIYIIEKLQEKDILLSSPRKQLIGEIEDVILEKLSTSRRKVEARHMERITLKAETFAKAISAMWKNSSRTFERFKAKHSIFFSGSIDVPNASEESRAEASTSTSSTPKEKEKSQRYVEAREIQSKFSPGTIHLAATQSSRAQGHGDVCYVMKKMASDPGNVCSELKQALTSKAKGTYLHSFPLCHPLANPILSPIFLPFWQLAPPPAIISIISHYPDNNPFEKSATDLT